MYIKRWFNPPFCSLGTKEPRNTAKFSFVLYLLPFSLTVLLMIGCAPFSFLCAQNKQEGYYIFPIQPGRTGYLSGNMGELRTNHLHSGIDIKTGGVEGLSVVAAAAGYISRIKMSAWGYGNALYIQHPNGETTVYGHLQRYADEIADYVRKEQYKQKTFEIELFPEKHVFPVKKGQLIAYSGNTGGSGGPHLHFEIRDSKQEVLNPLKYGFAEIKDNIAPGIEKVALITLEKDARINDQFGRFEFNVIPSGNSYTLKEPIAVYGKIGIEVLGYDRANGANNKNGIATIETYVNGEQVFYQDISKFAFSQTRDMLVLHNYPVHKETGKRFYKLYIDEGNELPFYKGVKNKGTITLKSASAADVSINFIDSYGNKSSLNFNIYNKLPPAKVAYNEGKNFNFSTLNKNTLKITAALNNKQPNTAAIYANRMVYEQQPDYTLAQSAVYLWDMRWGLPDSVLIGNEMWKFNFRATVPSKSTFNLYTPHANIYFPSRALYDTLYIQTSYWQDEQKEVFSISEDIFPLRRNIAVTLKPQLNYKHKDRTQVYRVTAGRQYNFEGGEWQNGNIKFNTRNFGAYTLLTDTIPPTAKAIKISKDEIRFTIKDDLSGIYSYEVHIDGAWLLMHYDYKRNLIWSDRLNKNTPLTGELVLKVKDQAGNEYIYTSKL